MSHARDVKVKKVKLMLDRERTIKFDLNAFIELEDMFGSVNKALEEVRKGSMKAARAVLWAGLIHEDESLTLKQVGAMLDMETLPRVTEALAEAIGGSLPEKGEQPVQAEAEVDAGNSQT
jgi:hypothetical protein